MDRRAAVALLGTVFLGGCGGGGGSAGSAGGPSVQPSTRPPGPSTDIAMWGDQVTPPVAANLQALFPGRLVFHGSIAGATSAQIAARQLADTSGSKEGVNIFWYGHNNPGDPARIAADIDASVAALAPGNDRFLVLSVLNAATPEQIRGGPVYSLIVQLNSQLANRYPRNFLDIRSFLVASHDPTILQDAQDQRNDVVPSSLRSGSLQLNNAGASLVALKVKEFLDGEGW
jgi:hypothetical protein